MPATPRIIDFTCVLDYQLEPVWRFAKIAAWRSRRAQGLPTRVTNVSVLARIAGMVPRATRRS